MKIKKQLLLLGTMLATAIGSQAAHYTDVDKIGTLLTGGSGNRYLGVFDIVHGDGDVNVSIGAPYNVPAETYSDVAGFTPGVNGDPISSIFAWFYFRDNNDTKTEAVRIGLDNTYLVGSSGGVNLNNQTISIFGGSGQMAIQALQEDGILRYNVIRTAGDFYFDYARLEVEAGTSHVPEGGATAMLLGLGVIAMGAARRKLA